MERFKGRYDVRELEVRGNELILKTGASKLDEVTEVYKSAQDAALAADFVRDAWRAEGYAAENTQPLGLLLSSSLAPTAPRGGSLLLGSSGEALRKTRPKPLKRIVPERYPGQEKALVKLLESDSLENLQWEGEDLVSATVSTMGSFRGNPLKALLKTKAARTTLRRLDVQATEPGDLADAIEVLHEPLPPNIESLILASYTVTEVYAEEHGEFSKALPAFGALKKLRLQAGRIELAKPNLPRLVELRLSAAGLAAETVRNVVQADWPNLESLEFFFGSERCGCTTKPADLAPVMSGERFPKLKTLRFQATEHGSALADALATSALLRQLRVVDLSASLLDADSAERLAAAMDPSAKLILAATSLRRPVLEALRKHPHVETQSPEFHSSGPIDSVEQFLSFDAE
jgi:hypothetical protein